MTSLISLLIVVFAPLQLLNRSVCIYFSVWLIPNQTKVLQSIKLNRNQLLSLPQHSMLIIASPPPNISIKSSVMVFFTAASTGLLFNLFVTKIT